MYDQKHKYLCITDINLAMQQVNNTKVSMSDDVPLMRKRNTKDSTDTHVFIKTNYNIILTPHFVGNILWQLKNNNKNNCEQL